MENQLNPNIQNNLSVKQVLTNPQTSQIQNKSNLLPIVFVAVVSAIVFGTVGYLMGKQATDPKSFIKDSQVPPSSVISTQKTSLPPIITESNFQKYSNQQLALSFQYPKDFQIQNDSLNQMTTEGIIETSIQNNKNSYAFDQFVLLVVKSDDPLSKYIKDFGETQNVPSPSTKTIDAFSVIEWMGFYKNVSTFYYSFSKDGYIFNFGLVAPEDITKFIPDNEQVLEQMISTLKFQ